MKRELLAACTAADVQVRPLWYPNHLQQPYREMQAYQITRAPRFYDTVLNLPCSLSLTPEQIADVVALVEAASPRREASRIGRRQSRRDPASGWTRPGRLLPGGLDMSDDGGTVVVLGGGGHAKVLISVIRKLPWTIAGYVDPRDVGPVLGVPHAGGDDVLPALLARHPGCAAAMGVGKVDATARRARIQAAAEALGYGFPTFVSPDAVVNCEVELGAGTVVFDGAVVNAGVVTGPTCVVNTNATVEHDCRFGTNVHIGPGATVSGGVSDRRPHLRRSRSRGHPRRTHRGGLPDRCWSGGHGRPDRAGHVRRGSRPEDPMSTGGALAVIPARGGWRARTDALRRAGTFHLAGRTDWEIDWTHAIDIDTEEDWRLADALMGRS